MRPTPAEVAVQLQAFLEQPLDRAERLAPTALLRERAGVVEILRSVVSVAQNERRDLTPEERTRFEQSRTRFDSLTAQIRAASAAEEGVARTDRPLRGSRGDPGAPGADSYRGDPWLPSLREYKERRAIDSTGNAFIPVGAPDQFFDHLRQRAVMLAAGPVVLPMTEATVNVPKIGASAAIDTVLEGDPLPSADPDLSEKITFAARKVGGFVLASSESLDDSKPELRQVVATDLVKVIALELDAQFLDGDGTPPNMTGIRNASGTTVLAAFNAGAGGIPTLDELSIMVDTLDDLGGNLERAAWFMRPLVWGSIKRLKDDQSRYQLSPQPADEAAKRLFDVPVFTTQALPSDEDISGSGQDTSAVLLADMEQVAVGRRQDVEIRYSEDFAFDTDQVAIRIICRFDIQPINAEAIVIRSGALDA